MLPIIGRREEASIVTGDTGMHALSFAAKDSSEMHASVERLGWIGCVSPAAAQPITAITFAASGDSSWL